MKVHRVLLRFDFEIKYDILDRPGQVMKSMSDTGAGFWSEIGESASDRKIRAVFEQRSEDTPWITESSYRVWVDPTTVLADCEFLHPIHSSNILKDEKFSKIANWMNVFFEQYGIKKIERAGLRVYAFEKVSTFDDVREYYLKSAINPDHVAALSKVFGAVSDVGVRFDTTFPDGVKLHFHSGPCKFSTGEYRNYLKSMVPSLDLLSGSDDGGGARDLDLVVDADIYENKFQLPSSPRRWAQQKLDLVNEVLSANLERIRKEVGNV